MEGKTTKMPKVAKVCNTLYNQNISFNIISNVFWNFYSPSQVKNKAPADIQITAEQLLREAKERDLEILPPPPKQKISDPEELRDYQHRKRKAFEDNIRKNRLVRRIGFV